MNTSGVGTAYPSGVPEFIPGLSGINVGRSLVVLVVFCTFVLYCLSFFHLRFLVIPLVSSKFLWTFSDYDREILSIVGNVYGECHVFIALKTSFVDMGKE